ncbi:MAG: hypothetical protein A3J48_03895 [Candidatus Doudnabacteria bacterium RIFCSPHIGHO2_02_FULL_46_11]|uniref:DUF4012 domain-containing protein n=1 Tax=Candidatus Doudnabacteria bacterium RIFCSPHIGHO2_02_FULL_46_11 TaxID=1817832 RepID=A0A1F5P898_9BACT|nr:MAG: hypothetical protein A3J48_03895 [Candidatus Doudnabacteria bacterium RIFCSPHIGHO2_02_FULL_46_11]
MYSPNFLPWQIKKELENLNPEQLNFRAYFWRAGSRPANQILEGVLLGFLFVAFVVVAFVGYPLVDAAYRAYQIYPLAKQAQAAVYQSDFGALYFNANEAYGHLVKLRKDTGSLARFKFLPLVGEKIEAANYTAAGVEKTVKVLMPALESLSRIDDNLTEVPAFERRNIINSLAKNSRELQNASLLLSQGSKLYAPEKIKQAVLAIEKTAYIASALPSILGLDKDARYLVIFANNLEIRPAGGFVGSYALMTVRDGEVVDFSVRNSYELPGALDLDLGPTAPAVAQRYLGIVGLPFRDSNWSPDYPESARTLKQAYAREGGEYHNEIQGVITVTTEVLREVMALTGPVEVNGLRFTEENVIDELERQVEIIFFQQGINWYRRKDIVGDLGQVLKTRIENFTPEQNAELLKKFAKLARAKHMVYSFDNARLQKLVVEAGWDGRVPEYQSDTLMLVDANLAGHKTEPAISKTYSYNLREENGKLVADLDIHYKHHGQLNPLVQNYRTYLRVYVPQGARLISTAGNTNVVDQSTELGRTVFGTLLVVPISQEKDLKFTYELPRSVSADDYSLHFIKQIGAYTSDLRLNFDFGNVNKVINDKLDSNKLYKP